MKYDNGRAQLLHVTLDDEEKRAGESERLLVFVMKKVAELLIIFQSFTSNSLHSNCHKKSRGGTK
jgi:hypothetical protein